MSENNSQIYRYNPLYRTGLYKPTTTEGGSSSTPTPVDVKSISIFEIDDVTNN